ncbi:hypothetical protein J0H33_09785 [bacterium]|nr:hypothetical protein [bacterium]
MSNAKVGDSQPSDRDRQNHAVGSVEVDLDGPDPGDAIGYTIFPSEKDAASAWDGGKPHPDSDTKITSTQVPSGIGYPAVEANGSIKGKNAFGQQVSNGGSVCAAIVGQVVVQGATISTDNADSGNVPAACALLKAGIAHLQTTESHLSQSGGG